MSAIRALSDLLEWIERAACRALIVAFTLLLIVNVSLRYLFSLPLFFAEELAALILVWMSFLAILVGVSRRENISVTILVDLLPERARRVTGVVTDALTLLIFSVLLWASLGWITSPFILFDQVITLAWPKIWFFVIVPFFCAAALVHILARFAGPRA